MSLFSKLFGGKSRSEDAPRPAAKSEVYGKGFRIFPEPQKAESGYRIAARIEKDFDGETREHVMIRADTIASEDEARLASLRKAQIFIDQMGDGIFD
ncbi:HlyU family transcriptional regulator [Celeribacter indicus]|uniref:Transcriptional activator HlyU n=1 Tax=Celeribacter indicus TaxID=1208324 RepID=A0A0B5DX46_9RHOB|nr:HlyU family transcriptional regulator [Celeribacter indicus]AJE48028.1 hypothetical protein P73_3313 [Celeribacter indicus]SDW29920.1 hypothetical protein SAMN05443573_102306 [Celeribacter indicus]